MKSKITQNKSQKLSNVLIYSLLVLIPLIITGVIVKISFLKKPVILIPNDLIYYYHQYSDNVQSGNSQITDFHAGPEGLQYNYLLKKGYVYPYAGFSIDQINENNLINLSGYSHIKIELSSREPVNLTFIVRTFSKKYTDNSRSETQVNYYYNFSGKTVSSVHLLPLNQFTVPVWWYESNNISLDIKIPMDKKRIKGFDLETGPNHPHDLENRITIKKIELYNSKIVPVFLFIIFFILYLCGILYFLKKNKLSHKSIPYKQRDISPDNENKINIIISYLTDHYHDMELTVQKVSNEVEIPARKISHFLLEKYNKNFSDYLNTIRITEAKRLLEETDLKIIDIAMSVGYKNISHFNKIFKTVENISPTAYRQKKQR